MLGLQEDERGRLRLHVGLFRPHYQERYVRLLPARIALGNHAGDLLEDGGQLIGQSYSPPFHN